MACSLNGIESSRRILNNGVGVNRMLLAEAIATWYPLLAVDTHDKSTIVCVG